MHGTILSLFLHLSPSCMSQKLMPFQQNWALLIWSRDGGFGTHLDERETSGPSMAPTLNNDGDVLIVERLSSRHGRIYPGDIVIACSPQNPNIKICKRVIGLEGDHISFHPNVGSRKVITVTVPKGHVWLQGDNIMHSQDSRHYGPVPFALLKGKVWMRIWPIDGLGRLD